MEKRRFLLSDMMMIVAAIAVGAWFARVSEIDPVWNMDSSFDSFVYVWMNFHRLGPYASAMSVAALLMGLRSPRPNRSRLTRRPGFVASFMASMLSILGLIALALISAGLMELHPHRDPDIVFEINWMLIGGATAGAWMLLGLSGRWHSEPTWIDRLGRVLGVFWLLYSLTSYLSSLDQ